MNSIPRGRLALWFAFGGILMSLFSLPWLALSFGFFAAALVTGLRAKKEAKAANQPEIAAGATGAVVVGGIGVAFGILALVGLFILRTEIARFEECALGANTQIAKQECTDRLMSDIQTRLNR